MSFEKSLRFGQTGESAIALWFQHKGCAILPVYEKILDTGKGPQLFAPSKRLIAPDMLVYSSAHKVWWVEAKHKTRFSWYGLGQRWVTGIDLRHYADYLQVDDESPWPVWLLFLHRESEPWDADKRRWGCPDKCPVGLFGNPISMLRNCESHRSDEWGSSGMVYWSVSNLKHLEHLENIDGYCERNVSRPVLA